MIKEKTDSAAIEIIDLFKTFNETETALSGVNLAIPLRKITFLLGPSGTGKSILLKHIVGLLWPDRGQIKIMGTPLPHRNSHKLNEIRKRLGVLFQGSALFDTMNVYENVAFPLSAQSRGLNKIQIRSMVLETLTSVGFESSQVIDKYPNQLSGGMQKRVALARAIILKPEILLYDEPTTGLDPLNRLTVEEMIGDTNERLGLTNFVISHDLEAALALADTIAFLDAGRIVFFGPPQEFRTSAHPTIQNFLRAERRHGRRIRHREDIP